MKMYIWIPSPLMDTQVLTGLINSSNFPSKLTFWPQKIPISPHSGHFSVDNKNARGVKMSVKMKMKAVFDEPFVVAQGNQVLLKMHAKFEVTSLVFPRLTARSSTRWLL